MTKKKNDRDKDDCWKEKTTVPVKIWLWRHFMWVHGADLTKITDKTKKNIMQKKNRQVKPRTIDQRSWSICKQQFQDQCLVYQILACEGQQSHAHGEDKGDDLGFSPSRLAGIMVGPILSSLVRICSNLLFLSARIFDLQLFCWDFLVSILPLVSSQANIKTLGFAPPIASCTMLKSNWRLPRWGPPADHVNGISEIWHGLSIQSTSKISVGLLTVGTSVVFVDQVIESFGKTLTEIRHLFLSTFLVGQLTSHHDPGSTCQSSRCSMASTGRRLGGAELSVLLNIHVTVVMSNHVNIVI